MRQFQGWFLRRDWGNTEKSNLQDGVSQGIWSPAVLESKQTEKVFVVCGGSSGIGLETCRAIAKTGGTVLLTSTNLSRAKEKASEIGENCYGYQLDLRDRVSIETFAQAVLDNYDRLDVLIHNAGLVLPRRTLTKDGIESVFMVTYLGPFYLTELLMPLVSVLPKTRIVNVASDLHKRAKMDWSNLQSEKSYDFIGAYSRAELAKMMWTKELSRRLNPEVATANSLHPGGVSTNLFRHFKGPMKWLISLSNILKSSPAKGARTSVHLSLSPEVENVTGEYFLRSRQARAAKLVDDSALASELWKRSEKMLGLA